MDAGSHSLEYRAGAADHPQKALPLTQSVRPGIFLLHACINTGLSPQLLQLAAQTGDWNIQLFTVFGNRPPGNGEALTVEDL